MPRVCWLFLALVTAQLACAQDSLQVQGTIVRKDGAIGIRQKDGRVVSLKRVEGLGSKDPFYRMARVPSGTYVDVKLLKMGPWDDRRHFLNYVRAEGHEVPSRLEYQRIELGVLVSSSGKTVESEAGTLRLHQRSFFPDGTPSGYHPSTEKLREAFIQHFSGKRIHAEFYALQDEHGQSTDLFLSEVRARTTEQTALENGRVIPAGAEVWISRVPKDGKQSVSYTEGNTTRGGDVPVGVLDLDPAAFEPKRAEQQKPALEGLIKQVKPVE